MIAISPATVLLVEGESLIIPSAVGQGASPADQAKPHCSVHRTGAA
jgi:hypothetical protein